MQIKEEKLGDILVVSIDDHLDTTAAPLLETRLLTLVETGARKLLIDCGNLQYVNSAGLKVFLLVAKKLEGSGKLVICSLAPSVLMIFEMIGFTRIMTIIPTREEGLQALADSPAAA
jgi:anti-sigma B factor antagonist